MINKTDFNKYVSSYGNYSKLKSILSIFTMGLFIFFGFASIDEGDPESRILDNCEFLPAPIVVQQKCTFFAVDEKGNHPTKSQSVRFQINEYEKVGDKNNCSLFFKNRYILPAVFDTSGKATFTLNKKYVSNDDEIEIFFQPVFAGYYASLPQIITLRRFDLSINYTLHLLTEDQYP